MGNWEILSRSSLAPASVHASLSPLKTEQSKNEFQFSKAGRNKGGKEGGREERFRCRKRTGGSWGPSSLCDWATRKVFEHLRWNPPTPLTHLRRGFPPGLASSGTYPPPASDSPTLPLTPRASREAAGRGLRPEPGSSVPDSRRAKNTLGESRPP